MNQNNDDIFDRMLALHLGTLDGPELDEAKQHLQTNPKAKELLTQIKSTLEPLSQTEIPVPENLSEKILNKIRLPELTVAGFLKDFAPAAPSRRRIVFNRFVDFAATAAAVLLIGSAILLSSGYVRIQARKSLCAENLGMLGSALSSYANDFNHQLPYAPAGGNEVVWYDPQTNQPHRGHLFILVKGNYIAPKFLICPEDKVEFKPLSPDALKALKDFPRQFVVSYSFQNVGGDKKFNPQMLQIRWQEAADMAVMADKTPLMKKDQLNKILDFTKVSSPNHPYIRGQNILSLDGKVTWQKTPFFGPRKDNIWQAGNIIQYSGSETPSGPTDSFLAP